MKPRIKQLVTLSLLLLAGAADMYAQSAIYACGHIRRNRASAITNLRNSGYTTAILFNVNVEEDGTLTTDYDWNNQTAAQAGGIICQDGAYVFDKYQPRYVSDVQSLLKAPTSINRIEICIGGWGNGSYGKIKKLIERDGTGEETMLYRNFKALKEAIPEIVAVNNDQEQDYDVASAVAFHRMMDEIGYKTTVAPYMNRGYWEELVKQLNEVPGTCELIYLQTYGGGAGNNPADWKVFGDVPMHVGFDCEASGDLGQMQSRFEHWRDNTGVTGGFLWNYNSEARNLNEWATTINRIFETKTTDEPVATFYQDANYGGYAVSLPVGTFTQADMAVYGIKAKDVSSIKINEGYEVTLCTGDAMVRGSKETWKESTPYVGDTWNDRARSIMIKPIEESGIADVDSPDGGELCVEMASGGTSFLVSGTCGDNIQMYNAAGMKIADVASDPAGNTVIDVEQVPDGIYIVKSGSRSAKLVKQ